MSQSNIRSFPTHFSQSNEFTPPLRDTTENVYAVVDICRRLDGIPLAIEMAAARMGDLSEVEIAAGLNDRFRFLIGSDRTAPPRHRTLRAMMDWSYELLSKSERTLLRRLCIFAGGWTLDAAENVCGGQGIERMDIASCLSALVASSLVAPEEQGVRMRYRLLETVRQFGMERSERMETEYVRRRHCDYFVQMAEATEASLIGSQQTAWMARLELEYDNFRTALAWCAQIRDAEAGLRLAGALWRFWYARGYIQEGQEWLERMLQLQESAPSGLRAKALKGAGNLAYVRGDYARACVHFEESLSLFRALGDENGMATSLASLANVANAQGDYLRADELFSTSLDLFRKLKDVRSTALTLDNQAMLACNRRDYVRACALHEESISIFREMEDLQNLVLSLNNLADTLIRIDQYERATGVLSESLALSEALDNQRALAHCLTNSLSLAVRQRTMERAAELSGACDALRERIEFPLPPNAVAEYRRDCEVVRSRLGAAAFEAAYLRGRAMTREQIVALLREPPAEERAG